jgi:uncharacterized protein YraI
MNFSTKLLAAGAMVLGLSGASAAMAADARTTSNLNIRVGPGVQYGYIDTIPAGAVVPVHGCIGDYGWCEVSFAGIRGWVSSDYLMAPGYGYYQTYGARVGVPVITFSFGDYHDRWYKGRPWYRHDRWAGRWDNRHKDRKEWHRDRRDAKKDWRNNRRDAKKDWKNDRREVRQEEPARRLEPNRQIDDQRFDRTLRSESPNRPSRPDFQPRRLDDSRSPRS